jgi:RNA-directed DNA polymerase
MTQVILGKSRVREICMPGSVRAKAEWLSYSTIGSTFAKVPLSL